MMFFRVCITSKPRSVCEGIVVERGIHIDIYGGRGYLEMKGGDMRINGAVVMTLLIDDQARVW